MTLALRKHVMISPSQTRKGLTLWCSARGILLFGINRVDRFILRLVASVDKIYFDFLVWCKNGLGVICVCDE